jgi:tetratricopeptide (TPR) repeat protein
LSEGRDRLDRALRESKGSSNVRAKGLVWASLLAGYQGDLARAMPQGRAGLEVYRTLGDRRGTAFALQTLGRTAVLGDDYRPAKSWLDQSLALFEEAGDRRGMGVSLYVLSVMAVAQGEYILATRLGKEALQIFQEIGDTRNISAALGALGRAELAQGNLESASRFYDECLTLVRRLGDRRSTGLELYHLAILARYRQDYARAQALATESLSISRDIGDKLLTGMASCELGILASLLGKTAVAATILEQSLEMVLETNDRFYLAHCVEALATVAHQQHQRERAATLFGAAAALRERIGAALELVERDTHDHEISSLRAELGETEWVKAWNEGRGMTLESVAALVRSEAAVPIPQR